MTLTGPQRFTTHHGLVSAGARQLYSTRLPFPSTSPTPPLNFIRLLVTRRRVTKRDRKRVAELYLSGRSIGYVASEVGIGRATVLDILKRFGIERRPVGLH